MQRIPSRQPSLLSLARTLVALDSATGSATTLSETPVHAVMGPELCLAALRATLERVGWADGSVPLTLAGCSYGGAMAMRYTSCWPDEVDRLVLVGTAGFDEASPTLVLRFGMALSRALLATVPPPHDRPPRGAISPTDLP